MGDSPFIEIGSGDKGVRATLYIGVDPETITWLTLGLFLALVAALAVYAKALQ